MREGLDRQRSNMTSVQISLNRTVAFALIVEVVTRLHRQFFIHNALLAVTFSKKRDRYNQAAFDDR